MMNIYLLVILVLVHGYECQTTNTWQPSLQPVIIPSPNPTISPLSPNPTISPLSPNPSGHPSPNPSGQPSPNPSGQPSPHPTTSPSPRPTTHPSAYPSPRPTSQPTTQPSGKPSTSPTEQPLIISSNYTWMIIGIVVGTIVLSIATYKLYKVYSHHEKPGPLSNKPCTAVDLDERHYLL